LEWYTGLPSAQAAAYRQASMRTLKALVIAGFAMFAIGAELSCVPQERLTGRPKLIDGDSFELGSVGVRLFGVDAPEGRQSCKRDGRDWACGDEAARKLRSFVGDRSITCTRRDVDDYSRVVAVCRVGNVDLAAEMARSGFATAYRRYSSDYVDEENEARAARRGIWAGEFTAPEAYRSEQRGAANERDAVPEHAQRDGCHIKGNISSDGDRIYHTRGSPAYGNTGIDEARGERWFCTEAEARAEGWRPPRARRSR
jgi:endonuclease YncB( thermonuclease family)